MIMSLLKAPWTYFLIIKEHRSLARQFLFYEINAKYRKSTFGLLWFIIRPPLLFLIYMFVFSEIMNIRFQARDASLDFDYSYILFSGLIIHFFMSDIITASPVVILENPNYVKRVRFPLEILPLIKVLSSILPLLTGYLILLAALVLFKNIFSPQIVLVFVVLIPYVILNIGIALFLASSGVFFRDISQFSGMISTVLLFGSPVLFPLERLPETLQSIVWFNPITVPVIVSRDIIFWNSYDTIYLLVPYTLFAIVIFWLGSFWFMNSKRGFADVM